MIIQHIIFKDIKKKLSGYFVSLIMLHRIIKMDDKILKNFMTAEHIYDENNDV